MYFSNNFHALHFARSAKTFVIFRDFVFNLVSSLYRATKLICNRAIHEFQSVCILRLICLIFKIDLVFKNFDIRAVPKKEDESITPLFIGRF
jgi:hypothetical protein